MDSTKIYLLIFTISFLAVAVIAPSPPQSHPLSEIAPINIDLNMSNQRIKNVSQIQLNNGVGNKGLLLDGFTISGEGQAQRFVLDYQNDEWDIENSDLNLNGNLIRSVGGVYGSSNSQCGPDQFLNGEGDCTEDSFETNTDNQNLQNVLGNGNSSGTYDIDMNNNDVENVNCLGDQC